MGDLNTYFRQRNLTDLGLLKALNKEVLEIGGLQFKYILKENLVNNTLLGESVATINYNNGFLTTGLIQTGVIRDTNSLVNEMGVFWDERVRVDIDLDTWLTDIRTHLNNTDYQGMPKEGDYMILINEGYSYDMFEVASVRRYDHFLQFNERQIFTLYLKKAVLGENLYTNFETTTESTPAEVKMVEGVDKLIDSFKPTTDTPNMSDFILNANDIDNLGF